MYSLYVMIIFHNFIRDKPLMLHHRSQVKQTYKQIPLVKQYKYNLRRKKVIALNAEMRNAIWDRIKVQFYICLYFPNIKTYARAYKSYVCGHYSTKRDYVAALRRGMKRLECERKWFSWIKLILNSSLHFQWIPSRNYCLRSN